MSKTEQLGYTYKDGKSIPQVNVTLRFSAVTSGSDENKAFFASTPSGELNLNLVNKEHADKFELMKEYYLDISSMEEEQAIIDDIPF